MEFKLRNNKEALIGFIQGVAMSYDRCNSFLKYFKFFDIKIKLEDDKTSINLEAHTEDYEVLEPQTIVLTPSSTTNFLIESIENSCELIHNEYLVFLKDRV